MDAIQKTNHEENKTPDTELPVPGTDSQEGPARERWQHWIPVSARNLQIQILAQSSNSFLLQPVTLATRPAGPSQGQKVLRKHIADDLHFPVKGYIFRPFKKIHRILCWEPVEEWWMAKSESLKSRASSTSVSKPRTCTTSFRRSGFVPGSGRSRRAWQPTDLRLGIHGQRSPAGCSPSGHKVGQAGTSALQRHRRGMGRD